MSAHRRVPTRVRTAVAVRKTPSVATYAHAWPDFKAQTVKQVPYMHT